MKKYIKMDQVLCKSDESEITEEELHEFMDEILELIESNGYITGGSFGLMTEEELDEEL